MKERNIKYSKELALKIVIECGMLDNYGKTNKTWKCQGINDNKDLKVQWFV